MPKYHTFKLIVGPFECTRSLRYINDISHYVEGLDGDGMWVMEMSSSYIVNINRTGKLLYVMSGVEGAPIAAEHDS